LKCNGITTPSATASTNFVIAHKIITDTIVSGNKSSVALSLVGATTPINVLLAVSLA